MFWKMVKFFVLLPFALIVAYFIFMVIVSVVSG